MASLHALGRAEPLPNVKALAAVSLAGDEQAGDLIFFGIGWFEIANLVALRGPLPAGALADGG